MLLKCIQMEKFHDYFIDAEFRDQSSICQFLLFYTHPYVLDVSIVYKNTHKKILKVLLIVKEYTDQR